MTSFSIELPHRASKSNSFQENEANQSIHFASGLRLISSSAAKIVFL